VATRAARGAKNGDPLYPISHDTLPQNGPNFSKRLNLFPENRGSKQQLRPVVRASLSLHCRALRTPKPQVSGMMVDLLGRVLWTT
jgi:hypothetical protein